MDEKLKAFLSLEKERALTRARIPGAKALFVKKGPTPAYFQLFSALCKESFGSQQELNSDRRRIRQGC